MDENKKLQEFETAFETCSIQYNSILKKIKELEKNPIIREYKNLQNNLSILSSRYDCLKREYMQIHQSNCKHHLWYFINGTYDGIEGKQNWTCKCIKCEIIKTGPSNFFKDNLIIEATNMGFGEKCLTDYDTVRNEYISLASSTEDQESLAKVMMKKYNNQKANK